MIQYKLSEQEIRTAIDDVFSRDVVLGTCTCTRVVLEYRFKVLVLVLILVLVLEGQVLAAMWQVL